MHVPKHRAQAAVAPEALRPKEIAPEETVRRVLRPRAPARADLAVLIVALVIGGILAGYAFADAMGRDTEDQLAAAELQAESLGMTVTGLEASTLFDPAGLYTPGRESGGLLVTVPSADATGLFTAAREGPLPALDPSGLYTGAREGTG